MVSVKITFICDTCKKEKVVQKKMNYKFYQEMEEGSCFESELLLPQNWTFEESTSNHSKLLIECGICSNKWKKKNGFKI